MYIKLAGCFIFFLHTCILYSQSITYHDLELSVRYDTKGLENIFSDPLINGSNVDRSSLYTTLGNISRISSSGALPQLSIKSTEPNIGRISLQEGQAISEIEGSYHIIVNMYNQDPTINLSATPISTVEIRLHIFNKNSPWLEYEHVTVHVERSSSGVLSVNAVKYIDWGENPKGTFEIHDIINFSGMPYQGGIIIDAASGGISITESLLVDDYNFKVHAVSQGVIVAKTNVRLIILPKKTNARMAFLEGTTVDKEFGFSTITSGFVPIFTFDLSLSGGIDNIDWGGGPKGILRMSILNKQTNKYYQKEENENRDIILITASSIVITQYLKAGEYAMTVSAFRINDEGREIMIASQDLSLTYKPINPSITYSPNRKTIPSSSKEIVAFDVPTIVSHYGGRKDPPTFSLLSAVNSATSSDISSNITVNQETGVVLASSLNPGSYTLVVKGATNSLTDGYGEKSIKTTLNLDVTLAGSIIYQEGESVSISHGQFYYAPSGRTIFNLQSVDWRDETPGIFQTSNIAGISINPNTGNISATTDVRAGSHSISVSAFNIDGIQIAKIDLNLNVTSIGPRLGYETFQSTINYTPRNQVAFPKVSVYDGGINPVDIRIHSATNSESGVDVSSKVSASSDGQVSVTDLAAGLYNIDLRASNTFHTTKYPLRLLIINGTSSLTYMGNINEKTVVYSSSGVENVFVVEQANWGGVGPGEFALSSVIEKSSANIAGIVIDSKTGNISITREAIKGMYDISVSGIFGDFTILNKNLTLTIQESDASFSYDPASKEIFQSTSRTDNIFILNANNVNWGGRLAGTFRLKTVTDENSLSTLNRFSIDDKTGYISLESNVPIGEYSITSELISRELLSLATATVTLRVINRDPTVIYSVIEKTVAYSATDMRDVFSPSTVDWGAGPQGSFSITYIQRTGGGSTDEISINSSTGVVSIQRGTQVGTYRIDVSATVGSQVVAGYVLSLIITPAIASVTYISSSATISYSATTTLTPFKVKNIEWGGYVAGGLFIKDVVEDRGGVTNGISINQTQGDVSVSSRIREGEYNIRVAMRDNLNNEVAIKVLRLNVQAVVPTLTYPRSTEEISYSNKTRLVATPRKIELGGRVSSSIALATAENSLTGVDVSSYFSIRNSGEVFISDLDPGDYTITIAIKTTNIQGNFELEGRTTLTIKVTDTPSSISYSQSRVAMPYSTSDQVVFSSPTLDWGTFPRGTVQIEDATLNGRDASASFEISNDISSTGRITMKGGSKGGIYLLSVSMSTGGRVNLEVSVIRGLTAYSYSPNIVSTSSTSSNRISVSPTIASENMGTTTYYISSISPSTPDASTITVNMTSGVLSWDASKLTPATEYSVLLGSRTTHEGITVESEKKASYIIRYFGMPSISYISPAIVEYNTISVSTVSPSIISWGDVPSARGGRAITINAIRKVSSTNRISVSDILNSGFTLESGGGVISIQPSVKIGEYEIDIDIRNQLDHKTVSIVVIVKPKSTDIPVYSQTTFTTSVGTSGSSLAPSLSGASLESNLRYFIESGAPSGVSIKQDNGIVTWQETPSSSVPSGRYEIKIYAQVGSYISARSASAIIILETRSKFSISYPSNVKVSYNELVANANAIVKPRIYDFGGLDPSMVSVSLTILSLDGVVSTPSSVDPLSIAIENSTGIIYANATRFLTPAGVYEFKIDVSSGSDVSSSLVQVSILPAAPAYPNYGERIVRIPQGVEGRSSVPTHTHLGGSRNVNYELHPYVEVKKLGEESWIKVPTISLSVSQIVSGVIVLQKGSQILSLGTYRVKSRAVSASNSAFKSQYSEVLFEVTSSISRTELSVSPVKSIYVHGESVVFSVEQFSSAGLPVVQNVKELDVFRGIGFSETDIDWTSATHVGVILIDRRSEGEVTLTLSSPKNLGHKVFYRVQEKDKATASNVIVLRVNQPSNTDVLDDITFITPFFPSNRLTAGKSVDVNVYGYNSNGLREDFKLLDTVYIRIYDQMGDMVSEQYTVVNALSSTTKVNVYPPSPLNKNRYTARTLLSRAGRELAFYQSQVSIEKGIIAKLSIDREKTASRFYTVREKTFGLYYHYTNEYNVPYYIEKGEERTIQIGIAGDAGVISNREHFSNTEIEHRDDFRGFFQVQGGYKGFFSEESVYVNVRIKDIDKNDLYDDIKIEFRNQNGKWLKIVSPLTLRVSQPFDMEIQCVDGSDNITIPANITEISLKVISSRGTLLKPGPFRVENGVAKVVSQVYKSSFRTIEEITIVAESSSSQFKNDTIRVVVNDHIPPFGGGISTNTMKLVIDSYEPIGSIETRQSHLFKVRFQYAIDGSPFYMDKDTTLELFLLNRETSLNTYIVENATINKDETRIRLPIKAGSNSIVVKGKHTLAGTKKVIVTISGTSFYTNTKDIEVLDPKVNNISIISPTNGSSVERGNIRVEVEARSRLGNPASFQEGATIEILLGIGKEKSAIGQIVLQPNSIRGSSIITINKPSTGNKVYLQAKEVRHGVVGLSEEIELEVIDPAPGALNPGSEEGGNPTLETLSILATILQLDKSSFISGDKMSAVVGAINTNRGLYVFGEKDTVVLSIKEKDPPMHVLYSTKISLANVVGVTDIKDISIPVVKRSQLAVLEATFVFDKKKISRSQEIFIEKGEIQEMKILHISPNDKYLGLGQSFTVKIGYTNEFGVRYVLEFPRTVTIAEILDNGIKDQSAFGIVQPVSTSLEGASEVTVSSPNGYIKDFLGSQKQVLLEVSDGTLSTVKLLRIVNRGVTRLAFEDVPKEVQYGQEFFISIKHVDMYGNSLVREKDTTFYIQSSNLDPQGMFSKGNGYHTIKKGEDQIRVTFSYIASSIDVDQEEVKIRMANIPSSNDFIEVSILVKLKRPNNLVLKNVLPNTFKSRDRFIAEIEVRDKNDNAYYLSYNERVVLTVYKDGMPVRVLKGGKYLSNDGNSVVDTLFSGKSFSAITLYFENESTAVYDSVVASVNIQGTLYTGKILTNISVSRQGALIVSVQEGSWDNPSTWDLKAVPTENDIVEVNHYVTLTSHTRHLDKITVHPTGKLNLSGFNLKTSSIYGTGSVILDSKKNPGFLIINPIGDKLASIPDGLSPIPKLWAIGNVELSSDVSLKTLRLEGSLNPKGNLITIHKSLEGDGKLMSGGRLLIAGGSSEMEAISIPSGVTDLLEMQIERDVVQITNELTVRHALLLNSGYYNIKGNKRLTLEGRVEVSSGGLLTNPESVVRVSGDSEYLELPRGFSEFGALEVARVVRANENIKIHGDLVLEDSLNMRNYALKLNGDLEVPHGNLNLLTGQWGKDGYQLIIEGTSKQFEMPDEISEVNKLEINRLDGALFKRGIGTDYGMEISDNTIVERVRSTISGPIKFGLGGTIKPPLQLSSKASGRSAFTARTDQIISTEAINKSIKSIEMWVKVASIGLDDATLAEINGSFKLNITRDYEIYFEVLVEGGANRNITTRKNLAKINEWIHIAGVYNDSKLQVYVNGVLRAEKIYSTSKKIRSSTQQLVIGKAPFSGWFDEILMWESSRSRSEIEEEVFNHKIGLESGLVAYYRMDEGEGNIAYNYSPKGVSLNGISGWSLSGALISKYLPTTDYIERKRTATDSRQGFLRTRQELKKIILEPQHRNSVEDTINIRYYDNIDRIGDDVSQIEVSTNNIMRNKGYWIVENVSKVIKSGKLGLRMALSDLEINYLELEQNVNLRFVYRFGPGSPWKEFIGQSLVKDSLILPVLSSKMLHGTIEVAVLSKKDKDFKISSVQSGKWSDPNTWENKIVPRKTDSIIVKHRVELDVNGDARDVHIQDVGNIFSSLNKRNSLSVFGQILVSPFTKSANGGIGIEQNAIRLMLLGRGSSMTLPKAITKLNYLEIDRSREVRIEHKMTVLDTLFVRQESLYIDKENGGINIFNAIGGDEGGSVVGRVVIRGDMGKCVWLGGLSVQTVTVFGALHLEGDMKIFGNLDISDYNAKIERNGYGILVAGNILPDEGYDRINTPLVRDSVASGWSAVLYELGTTTSSKFEISDSLTIEVWITSDGIWKGGSSIVAKKQGGYGYTLKLGQQIGEVQFVVDDVVASSFDSRIAIDLNKWYHIAGVINRNNIMLYINGVEVSRKSIQKDYNNSLSPFAISPNIRMDEIKLWHRSKSGYELRKEMHRQIWQEDNLVANYRFDAGSRDTIYDYSKDSKNITSRIQSWKRSGARIVQYKTYSTYDEKIHRISSSIEEQTFIYASRDVSHLIIKGKIGTQEVTLRGAFLDRSPEEVRRVLNNDDDFDSLKTTAGLWQFLATRPLNEEPIKDIEITFSLNETVLKGLEDDLDRKRLAVYYRYAPGDKWKESVLIGTLSAESQEIKAFLQDGISGYTEIAIGVKTRYVRTLQKGSWNTGNIWSTGNPPRTDDKVLILHPVELDQNISIQEIRFDAIEDKSNGDVSTGSLTGNKTVIIQKSITKNEQSVIADKSQYGFVGPIFPDLWISGKSKSTLPSIEVNKLIISKNSKENILELEGDLIINDGLSLEKGTLQANSRSVTINGSIFQGDDGRALLQYASLYLIGSKSQSIPDTWKFLGNLFINKENQDSEVSIINDIIARDTVKVNRGVLKRNVNGILASTVLENAPHGKITPFLNLSDSASGRALFFDGSSHVILDSREVLVSEIEGLTVEAWVNYQVSPQSSLGSVIAQQESSSGSLVWELSIASHTIRFRILTRAGDIREITLDRDIFKMKDDVWYHAAVTYSTHMLTMYINGVKVTEVSYDNIGFLGISGGNVYVGGIRTGTRGFSGMIDELRIWRRVLDQNEIRSRMGSQLSGFETSLVSYYRFDEGTDNRVVYGFSKGGTQGYFVGDGVQFSTSNARIGTFRPTPYSSDIKKLTLGLQKETSFLDSKQSLLVKGSTTGEELIRISYYNFSPLSFSDRPALTGALPFYWTVEPTKDKLASTNIFFRKAIKDISSNVSNKDINKLIWLRRVAPTAPWEILGSKIVSDTIMSETSVSVTGYSEIVLASLESIEVAYENVKVERGFVNIVSKLKTSLSANAYHARFVILEGKQGIVRAYSPYFQADNDGLVAYTFSTLGPDAHLLSNSNYIVSTQVRYQEGISHTLENTVSVFTTLKKASTTITNIVKNVNGIYRISSKESDYDELTCSASPSENVNLMVIRYETKPLGRYNVPNQIVESNFYWSIEASSPNLNNVRLFMPVDNLFKITGDSSNLKWMKRSDFEEIWEDVTDITKPIVWLKGKRFLRTRLLNSFSDFIIGVKETPATTQGIISPKISLKIQEDGNIVWKGIVGADIGTGSAYTNVQATYLESQNQPAKDHVKGKQKYAFPNPSYTTILDTLENIDSGKRYFYLFDIYNRRNNEDVVTTDTGWISAEHVFSVEIESIAKNPSETSPTRESKLNIGDLVFYMNINDKESSSEKDFYLVALETLVTISKNIVEQKPSGVEKINPLLWRMSSVMKDRSGQYSPLKSINKSREVMPIDADHVRIGRRLALFGNAIDSKFLTWLWRKDQNHPWKVIDGEILSIEGEKYFFSKQTLNSLQGEFAIGLKNALGLSSLAQIKQGSFTAKHLGHKRVRIEWESLHEESTLQGYEIIKISENGESIVSSYLNDKSLIAQHEDHRYNFMDKNVDYGETYIYNLRLYSGNGAIYEISSKAVLAMPRSKEELILTLDNLDQNYPNPFNYETTIEYTIRQTGHVKLEIIDMLGRRVLSIVDGQKESGHHRILFFSRVLAAGVYFYRLVTQNSVISKKMVYLPGEF